MFSRNLAKYEFDTICKQDKGLTLPDDRHTVFVNAQGVTNDQKLKEFLAYLRDGEVSDSEFIQNLDKAVNYASKSSKWREEYDMLLAREQLLIEEGRKEGLAEGLAKGLAKGVEKGRAEGAEKERTLLIKHALQDCKPEDVSKLLGIPLHEILKIVHEV